MDKSQFIILPAYFAALEKYFATHSILHENACFVALSNVISPMQIKKYSLKLCGATKNKTPCTTLKNLTLNSVADVCETDWIDAISEI